MSHSRLCTLAFCIAFLCFGSCKEREEPFAKSADGVPISFTKMGSGDPAIVFVHGWANDRSIWRDQMAQFSKKHTVVSVDLAGFGASGNGRTNYTTAVFGDDVVAVVEHLKLKHVVLVGFSMGGPVILEASLKIPDQVAGIVLVDNLQDVEMKYPPEIAIMMDSVYMDLVSNLDPKKLVGSFYKKNPDEAYNRISSMLEGKVKPWWRKSLHETMRWNNEDRETTLKKVKAPIVAINADLQPTNVEAFQKLVPSYQAKIIPNTGHLLFWDEPEQFAQMLEKCISIFMAYE